MIPDTEKIEKRLLELQERKDRVLLSARDVIRLAGKAITALHASDARKSGALLKSLKAEMAKLRKMEKGFEYHTLQAHQEYVEALTLYWIINKRRFPRLAELGEDEVAYLLGMMDVVGELKRKAFEELRTGRLKEAERYYGLMTELYDSTYAMKFAGSLVPDFRKKQDVARIQLEHLRSELLFAKRHSRWHTG